MHRFATMPGASLHYRTNTIDVSRRLADCSAHRPSPAR